MGFYVTDRDGAAVVQPDGATIDTILAGLHHPGDGEHPDVSLVHHSEWSLSVFAGGLLVWENLESDSGSARHMDSVPRSEVRRLWLALAAGDLQTVEAENWREGYS